MSKPNVMSIFGTRPEAIKMAPVVLALQADSQLEHLLVVTAQHRGLLDDVLELFRLKPAYDLDIMQSQQSLGQITSRVLDGVGDILAREQPDFVLVHGDTSTTLAAALAAFYAHIPVGHVEAGLRTSSINLPFPEEFNRRCVDLFAQQLYCPTQGAVDNLTAGGQLAGEVFLTGNTALDAVKLVAAGQFEFADQRLAAFLKQAGPTILLTAHRRENWGKPLADICNALVLSLEDYPEAKAVVCWHPNPAVRETMEPILGGNDKVLLLDPPRFDVFVNLIQASDLILTDSGGIQEEITVLGRYALVLRPETERPEAVSSGYARVVGVALENIREGIAEALPKCVAGSLPPKVPSPFGDGNAAQRIHRALRYGLGLDAAKPADYAG